jgi:hypothetical protein
MSFRLLLAALLALGLAGPAAAAEPAKHRLTDLVPIPLKSGPNTIERFAPDGRGAIVTLGWRENGNAHAYDLFLVLMQGHGGGWNVVGFDNLTASGGEFEDTIRDTPHAGEDVVRSVRFVRGKIDGEAATMVFVAQRGFDPEEGIPGPSLVDYTVYRLMPGEEIGTTTDMFQPVETQQSTTRFCHAEKALLKQYGLPLTRSYGGPDTADGC